MLVAVNRLLIKTRRISELLITDHQQLSLSKILNRSDEIINGWINSEIYVKDAINGGGK
jgi:hypothetical protein